MARGDDGRAKEFLKCAADVAYFVHTYCVIDDTQGHGDGGGVMPFHLWPVQVGVLWDFLLHRLVLILKARQLGISWLCCAYALWLCLFHPGKVVMLFSKGKLEANELLRRIKVLYERLPEWLKEALPPLEIVNTTTLGWGNASRVQSNPATQNAGRSFTASLVILDEAGFLQWATALYTAMKPVIDGGGQLIILSTANGIGNLFHRLWTRTAKKLSNFHAIFLPWWSRPGRDAAWYEQQVADADDPALVPQEYPATANEAFVSSGRVRFSASWIKRLADRLENGAPKPLPIEQLPAALQKISGLVVYALPRPGVRYVLAADPAEGKEGEAGQRHGDYSAATLVQVCARSGRRREVAHLHGHIEPGAFGLELLAIARAYNAELVIARKNHGHATILAVQLANDGAGYPLLIAGPDGQPGWDENSVTKPLMIDALAEALRDDGLEVNNPAAVDEMQVYAVLKNGATGAPEGYHDDLVVSWAIANIIARFPPALAEGETEMLDEDEYREEISPY